MYEPEPRHANGLTAPDGDARARERLLRAAADVFDRKGYAAASVREIVEQARITKPVLYYHFGSKEGMLTAILDEGERLLRAGIARAFAQPGGTRERVVALCEEFYRLFKENASAVRVAHALYFGPREGLPAFDWCRFERLVQPAISRLAEEGIATGDIRHCRSDDVARAISFVISGCSDLALNREATTLEFDAIRPVIDLIFDGLSAAREQKEN